MNIAEIQRINTEELKQLAIYDHVVVIDPDRRAREIEFLLAELARLQA